MQLTLVKFWTNEDSDRSSLRCVAIIQDHKLVFKIGVIEMSHFHQKIALDFEVKTPAQVDAALGPKCQQRICSNVRGC